MYDIQTRGCNIEFKKAADKVPRDFWPTYSSFANTSGGTIILGVEEKANNTFTTSGVVDPEKIAKDIFDTLNSDKVSVNLLKDSDIEILEKDGMNIVTVNVPEAHYSLKPVYLSGTITNAFIRRGEGDYRCTEAELRNMIRNANEVLDEEVLVGFTIDDIDMETLHDYRKKLNSLDKSNFYSNMNDTEFLLSVGALKRDRKTGAQNLSLGGLLFFGNYTAIKDEVPHFHLEYLNHINAGEKRWIDRIAAGDMSYPNLNLYKFFLLTLEKLKATVKDSFELDESLSRVSNNDLEVALREALANSIIHADYRQQTPIKIAVFNDYYEFENPGQMRVSVEEFAMGGKSSIRNHVIELLFRKAGFCERAGSGGQKIFQTASKKNYRTPDVEKAAYTTLLRFWNIGLIESFNEYDDQTKEILTIIKKNVRVPKKQVKQETGFTDYKIITTLNKLLEDGVVEKHGNGRATIYTLAESDSEKIATLERLFRDLQKGISRKGKS